MIGVQDYTYVADIPGAAKNAEDWYRYLTHGRGISPGNALILRDSEATKERILRMAARIAKRVKPGGTVWLVFVGHGAPSRDAKQGLLVGADAQQDADSLFARGVSLEELARAVTRSRRFPLVAVVDACFSGRTASGDQLAKGLQPLLAVRRPVSRRTKGIVMTAGTADQFAGPLSSIGRPAFSYLVLGAMRGWGDTNRDGRVTGEEAAEYAREALGALVTGRTQTPQFFGSGSEVLSAGAAEAGPDLAALVLAARKTPAHKRSFSKADQPGISKPAEQKEGSAKTAAQGKPSAVTCVESCERKQQCWFSRLSLSSCVQGCQKNEGRFAAADHSACRQLKTCAGYGACLKIRWLATWPAPESLRPFRRQPVCSTFGEPEGVRLDCTNSSMRECKASNDQGSCIERPKTLSCFNKVISYMAPNAKEPTVVSSGFSCYRDARTCQAVWESNEARMILSVCKDFGPFTD